MKRILLLTDFSSGYSRNLLQGIVKYAKKHGPWVFYRLPLYYRKMLGDKGVAKWAKEWKADAVIAQLSNIDLNALYELKIPIIVQNYKERNEFVSNITGDYLGTGELAADFFIHRGYKNFAYYGFSDAVWMRERGEGFSGRLKEHGFKTHCFEEREENVGEEGRWEYDAEKLKGWLVSLPKPVGLFACDDFFALQVTEVCKMNEINIPEDISILGVDNDQLLCSISDPTLSSIELNVELGGYEAGKLLDEYFRKEKQPPINIVIKPVRLVLRDSTEKFSVTDKYVEQVLRYIENNYQQRLTVDRIIEMVPYSRRVFERKFKEETHMTIYQYVQEVRISKLSELLITTNLPLVEVATMVGFDDYNNVSRSFVKYKGISPLQYRKKHKLK